MSETQVQAAPAPGTEQRWIRGFCGKERQPYVLLRCVCNTDTIFELPGNGVNPKPNCCVNAPAYPKSPEFWVHLFAKPTELESTGMSAQVEHYDKKLDEAGGRPKVHRILGWLW